MSYSQYGEDAIFLPLLAECESKRLIEIGAWDPITFSNSRALIKAGWSALLIEPSPGPLKNLAREYSGMGRVQVMGAAVTVEGGIVELEITDDAVTMPSGERIEEWRAAGGFYGKLLVPSLSVTELFTRFGAGVEFVSIDTEGTSADVFISMVKVGCRPRMVCLEHDARYVEIAQYAEAANYRQVHLNGTNVIYEWTGVRE